MINAFIYCARLEIDSARSLLRLTGPPTTAPSVETVSARWIKSTGRMWRASRRNGFLRWPGTTARAETTPLVVEGVMYVTSANECWALDAGTGREIWHFRRPRTLGLIGNAAGGFNRGVAWSG